MGEVVESSLSLKELNIINKPREPEPEHKPETAPTKETSQVAMFLSDRKERYKGEKHGRTLVLTDLTDLLGANIDDTRASDPATADAKTKRLSEIRELVLKMATREELKYGEIETVRDYILKKETKDQETGGNNQDIFTAFKQLLPKKLLPEAEQQVEKPAAITETEIKPDLAQLPEYRYRPDEKLKTFFKEVEKKPITLETVKNFVTAEQNDLVTQGEKFEAKYATVIAPLDKAEEFLINLNDQEIEQDKMIIVVEKDGEIIAGWEDAFDDADSIVYRFDPKDFSQLQRRNAYRDLLEGTERQEGINTGLQRLQELLTNPRTKMTEMELFPIFTSIDRYTKYLQQSLLELSQRFDGADPHELEDLLLKDTEAMEQYNSIMYKKEILQELTNQVRKKIKSEKGRIFKGIAGMRDRFRKKSSGQKS